MALTRYGLAAAVAAIAIALTGVAAVGTGLVGNPLAASPGGTTAVGSLAAPTWTTNDTWVYNVTLSAPEISDRATVLWGSVQDKVTGTVTDPAGESVYNVTTTAVFHVRSGDQEPDKLPGLDAFRITFAPIQVDGYTWYRTSDLAIVRAARTASTEGTLHTFMGNITVKFAESTLASFQPALTEFKFPLTTNETWANNSTANLTAQMRLEIDARNSTFQMERAFTRDVPVRFDADTGPSTKTVSTPAGNFTALPVRFEHPEFNESGDGVRDRESGNPFLGIAAGMSPAGDSMDRLGQVVTSLGTPMFAVHPGIVAWYSSQVGNIVKATALQADGRVFRMVLVWTNVA